MTVEMALGIFPLFVYGLLVVIMILIIIFQFFLKKRK